MSHKNVEIVRTMLAGCRALTRDTDDWLDEFCDPEIEWHDVPIYPSAGRSLWARCHPSARRRVRGRLGGLGHRD